jgi:hypothetical protein
MRGVAPLVVGFVAAIACGGVSTRSSGDGASKTGGSAGSATAGGATSTGGLGPTPPRAGVCETVEDCTLSTDCCSCFAAGPGEATATCRRECTPETTACALEGTTAADVRCFAGRCVLNRFCDLELVTCERARPECPAGTVPSQLGDCYGPCTGVSECMAVPSCDDCGSVGLACVESTSPGPPLFTCASMLAECEANPTCACMEVCQDDFICVDPDSTYLFCDCPHC